MSNANGDIGTTNQQTDKVAESFVKKITKTKKNKKNWKMKNELKKRIQKREKQNERKQVAHIQRRVSGTLASP